MLERMNNKARHNTWKQQASEFVCKIWSPFNNGFVFLATRSSNNQRWKQHHFNLPISQERLVKHFSKYSRDEYDHYFCPNAFSEPLRRAEYTLATPYTWVDIDDANPDSFDPAPGILIRTSPQRFQGVWVHEEIIPASDAEIYSKGLAYKYNADTNGWSSTKYLRVPWTRNHKPNYNQPIVRLIRNDFSEQIREAVPISIEDFSKSKAPIIYTEFTIPKNNAWK